MARKPNLILFVTDQQGADMMSCAGNPWLKTPAMDELGRRGIRFEHAYCSNPVCLPSRVSLFTGRFPSDYGIRSNSLRNCTMSDDAAQESLGAVLAKAGYDLYYGGKIHLPKAIHPEAMGFNYFTRDEREELARLSAEIVRRPHSRPYCLVVSLINPHDICLMAIRDFPYDKLCQLFVKKLTTEIATLDEALKLPEGMDEDEFFATCCPPLRENHQPQEDEPEAIRMLLQQRPFKWAARTRYTEREWRLHRWAYCRLTERVDREIGIVLDALDQADDAENTLVMFTSDHGDMDGAHAMEHKTAFYREAVKVPFIVSGPGIEPGKVDTQHLVSNGLDILPTLADYAGVAAPAGLRGRSLRPLLEGSGEVSWRDVVRAESEFGRMVASTRYKYARYEAGASAEQLYDMEVDPGETRNFAHDPEYQSILADMRSAFEREFAGFSLPFDPDQFETV
ncbi:MAG: DUF4976 domain-containing protein [Lentisphaerae bacterium]|nr:MAG: DUF4976 domain-containing protein [Lentisphaerota bacterium]